MALIMVSDCNIIAKQSSPSGDFAERQDQIALPAPESFAIESAIACKSILPMCIKLPKCLERSNVFWYSAKEPN